MNLNDILRLSAQTLFIVLSVIAFIDYLGHRDARRRDFTLLAASLGFPLGITLLRDLFGLQYTWLNLLGAFALFSQPYFLFRLLQYYRPSRPWIHGAVLLGMVLCWVILLEFIAIYPKATQIVIFGYCAVVDAYCTWGYIRGMHHSVGILRRRLLLISISSSLFTLAVLGNVVSPLLPNQAADIGVASLAVAAMSAILFYLAFVPPRWLRNSWQFEELRDFLMQVRSPDGSRFSMAESFQQLCLAANQAVNGMGALVIRWDDAAHQWVVVESTDAAAASLVVPSDENVVEQVWRQRRPLAISTEEPQREGANGPARATGVRSWLLVPILTVDHIWGVLAVGLHDRSLFIDDDLSLLELFARQCAIVLENRQLIGELQGYSAQLEENVKARTTELSESEARFRYLADSAPVMIWMIDVQGKPIYSNQQWRDFVGPLPAGATEMEWVRTLVHPEDARSARLLFERSFQQQRAFRQEFRFRRHDGVYRWLLNSAVPRQNQSGEFVGFIGSILDITDRKEAEERLQVIYQLNEAVNRAEEVEQIYELALSGLEHVLEVPRAAILLFDQTGALHVQAWRGLSATYRAATDGQLPQVIDEDEPQPVFIPDLKKMERTPALQAALDEGIRAIGYIPLVTQNRLLGKFMVYYDQPHSFPEAEVQWAQTIARHVAHALQRKQAEVRLHTYTRILEELNHTQLSLAAELDIQKLLQMVVDVSTELSGAQFGAFLYSADGYLTDGRAANGQVNGYNGNGTGHQPRLLYALTGVPPEATEHLAQPHVVDDVSAALDDVNPIRIPDVSETGDNAPVVLWHGLPRDLLSIRSYLAVPVVSRAQGVIGGLFFGHRKPNVFTEQAEQLVGSLAGQMAITLENAQLYAQIRESETALRELNATLEERVEKRTAELRRSNDELEQFAYIASHDLKAPLRAISLLGGWIQEDAGDTLPPTSREHLAKLLGRVHRMGALLDDLLAYSRVGRQRHPVERVDVAQLIHDVTETIGPPAGFTVQCEGEMPFMYVARTPLETVFRNLIGNAIKHHHQVDKGVVTISAHEKDEAIAFTVADNGPGIAPEFHQRIFEIFQTLQSRDRVESSGIGLAIVKKSVESHGGAIWVESPPGEGTIFHFTWPKVAPFDEEANL